MRNGMVAAFLVLVGVIANWGPLASRSANLDTHSETTKATAAKSDDDAEEPDHPLSTLSGYLGPSAGIPKTPGFDVCPGGLKPVSNTDLLIATVPDPERTHLALMFDRHIEAILLAAQDAGYFFDRYWLPWRVEPDHDSPYPRVRKLNEKETADRERLPGLLLFHPVSGNRSLAVFLVGETPTDGIDPEQFKRARCYVSELAQDGDRGILGPMFSGSLSGPSKRLLDEPSRHGPIISGTVTGPPLESPAGFATTVNKDCDGLRALLGKFSDWDRVVLLSEDGTGYGNYSATCNHAKLRMTPRLIYYPREISRLRNAYQDQPSSGPRASSPLPSGLPELQLRLGDALAGRDTVPLFSAEQTPASQETMLFQIANTLRLNRTQAVILSGTNVLDTLFLTHFLRQCCADVRVAVMDADLLFVHGNDSLDYLGVIAVSSFPLSPVVRPEGLHEFGSNLQEGAYYAALLLLGETPQTATAKLFADYAGQFSGKSKSPPVWISVVGRGEYLPLAVIAPEGFSLVKPLVDSPANQVLTGYPNRVWNVVYYSSALLITIYCLIYLYAARRDPLALPRWCADLSANPEGISPSARAIFSLLMWIMILAAWTALCRAPVVLGVEEGFQPWAPQAVVSLVVALLPFTLFAHMAWRWDHIVVRVVSLAAFVWLVIQGLRSPDHQGLFRAQRSVDLASGISPILPFILLLLMLAYFCWISLQRVIFIEERDIEQSIPLPGVPWPVGSLLRPGIDYGIRSLLQNPSHNLRVWMARCVGAASALLGGWIWLQSLGEDQVFTLSFLALFCLGAGLLAGQAWSFLELWHGLRGFLQDLDLHPIRAALSALPPMSSFSPLWQSSARKRNYAIFERSRETLDLLYNTHPFYYPDFRTDALAAPVEVDPIFQCVRDCRREPTAERARAFAHVNRIAFKLEVCLRAGVWQQGSSESFQKIKDADKKKKLPPPSKRADCLAAEFLALRVVAYIRYVMLHLRNQLSFLTGGFVFLALALNSYPFGGEAFLHWWLVGAFLAFGSITVVVFLEMERDPTLSRLTDTRTDQIDTAFYGKLISAGALPCLAILSMLFPSIGRGLFAWVEPTISALH